MDLIEYKSGQIAVFEDRKCLVSSDGQFFYLIDLNDNFKMLFMSIGLHHFNHDIEKYDLKLKEILDIDNININI